jgi:hypothetical protein
MRTTVDLPDDLFRRTKALAALRGDSLKELIVRAVEHEVIVRGRAGAAARPTGLPLLHLRKRRKLDLTGFDFDDLLA